MSTKSLEERLIPICSSKIYSSLSRDFVRFLIGLFYLSFILTFSGVMANLTVYSYYKDQPLLLILILLSFPIGYYAYWVVICWCVSLRKMMKTR